MEKIQFYYGGRFYDAVEFNGECVSDEDFHYDTIILADTALNEVITDCLDSEDFSSDAYRKAEVIDNQIFGYAPLSLIINGSSEELEQYAKELL